MSENIPLLIKLEEKMMMLISEVEDLRKENYRLNHENSSLKTERENSAKKIQEFLALLDAVNVVDNTLVNINMTAVKPVYVQEAQEQQN